MNNDRSTLANELLIPFIVVTLLFIVSVIFGIWSFGSRQDYKNKTNQKISVAVQLAEQATKAEDAKQYALDAQNPFKTFDGPEEYGSIKLEYPKTWDAYINQSNSGSETPIDSYFQPNYLTSVADQNGTNFALRLQVNSEAYSQILSQYNQQAQDGQVSVTSYALPKVPSVTGVMVSGQILNNQPGEMIILPLRSTTLEVWTESTQYESQFNSIILPNLSFSP